MSDEQQASKTEARLVPAASAKVRPLYEPARLVKWAVFEVAEVQRQAEAERAAAGRERAAAEADREAVRKLSERSDAVMAEAREKAAAVVEEARAEARRIVEAAGTEAAERAEDYRREGVAAGRAEGRAAFDQLLANLPGQRSDLEEAFATEAGNAAFRLAQVILDVEFALRPERVAEHVRQVIAEAGVQERIVVRLNPADVQLVESSAATEHHPVEEIQLAADPGVARGDCRVETATGNYDGTVAAQLDELRQRLQLDGSDQ